MLTGIILKNPSTLVWRISRKGQPNLLAASGNLSANHSAGVFGTGFSNRLVWGRFSSSLVKVSGSILIVGLGWVVMASLVLDCAGNRVAIQIHHAFCAPLQSGPVYEDKGLSRSGSWRSRFCSWSDSGSWSGSLKPGSKKNQESGSLSSKNVGVIKLSFAVGTRHRFWFLILVLERLVQITPLILWENTNLLITIISDVEQSGQTD